jgi:hypothetical protein
MKPLLDITLLLMLFGAYFYSQQRLHGLLRRLDQKMYASVYVQGRLEIPAILKMCGSEPGCLVAGDAKRVMRLIRINNFVVFLSYGLVLIFLLNEAIK